MNVDAATSREAIARTIPRSKGLEASASRFRVLTDSLGKGALINLMLDKVMLGRYG